MAVSNSFHEADAERALGSLSLNFWFQVTMTTTAL